MLAHLGRWGARSPAPAADRLSVDSQVLALPALFDRERAPGFSGTFGLRLGDDSFVVRVKEGRFAGVERGEALDADATLATDLPTFQALLWGGVRPAEARRSESAVIEGNSRALTRFLGLFPVPEPASG